MKTSDFDQQFTAWLDGKLSPEEASAFEQEMRSRGFEPEAERTAALKLGDLLRAHSQAPALGHEQFFNHMLQRQIATEQPQASRAVARRSWFGIPWLAWAGAACLLISAVLIKAWIPVGG